MSAALAAGTVPPAPKPIDPATWIGPGDLPPVAARAGIGGKVGYRLKVGANGAVRGCKVTQPSGVRLLDREACRLLRLRARFTPADEVDSGKPVASTYTGVVDWTPPRGAFAARTIVSAAPLASPDLLARQGARDRLSLALPGFGRSGRRILASPLLVPSNPTPPPVIDPKATTPPPDPRMVSGTLPNGLRYAILRNVVPIGSASFRMRIGAGSVEEGENERGYAHFLEHMTFRGSSNVADGEFARSLEAMGLSFGDDTTANTGFESIEYGLNFPTLTPQQGARALFLLREAASRATIAPAAVEAERGVVLSEERLRDGPALHAEQARLSFLLAGQRIPTRWSIGTTASIAHAGSERLTAFYRAHFRPDDTIITVVGDVDPDATAAEIRNAFGDWSVNGPPAGSAPLGAVQARGEQVKLFVEPGAPERVEADWVSPYDPTPDSYDRERGDFAELIAQIILNERLARRAIEADAPFAAAKVQRANLFHSAKVTTLAVTPIGGAVDRGLAAAMREERRLAAFGATQPELDRAITLLRTRFAQAKGTEDSRPTAGLAIMLMQSMESGDIFTTPAQDEADFARLAPSFTLDQINGAAKRVFQGSGPLVFVSGGQPPAGGEQAIRTALLRANREPLTAFAAAAQTDWPYASFGPPSAIVERSAVPDLGVTIVRFANGTSVTVKPTPLTKGQVLVDLAFGAGIAGLPQGLERSYWMLRGGASAFIRGGLGKRTVGEVADELTGKAVTSRFEASDERFNLVGETRPDDLDVQLQLLTAYVADPGFRPEAVRQAASVMAAALPQFDRSALLTVQRDMGLLLHGGDPRWSAMPDGAALAQSRPEDLVALLRPSLAGPLDLVIVGDVDLDGAIAAARATIGALPPRQPRPAVRSVNFPAETSRPVVELDHGRPDQAVALAAWPTRGFFASTADARAIQVLGEVVRSRLIEGLREKEGLTYSPIVRADQSETFPDYGVLAALVEITPGRIDRFYAELDGIMRDLARTPIGVDELERARAPLLNDSRLVRQSAQYWLRALIGADQDLRRLDTIRTRLPEIASVSPADIQRLAAQYLAGRQPFRVIVRAATATPSMAEAGGAPMVSGAGYQAGR